VPRGGRRTPNPLIANDLRLENSNNYKKTTPQRWLEGWARIKLALRRFPPTLVKHWEKLKKPMQTPRQGA